MWGKTTSGILALALILPKLAVSIQDTSLADAADRKSAQKLVDDLTQLAQSPNLREAKLDQASGLPNPGRRVTNNNDGNSFGANFSYHSTVRDLCVKWISPQKCEKWVPKYVSLHYQHADSSKVEKVVGDAHEKYGSTPIPQTGSATSWSIWEDIKTRNGAPLADKDGKLNQKDIVQMRVRDDLKKQLGDVANKTYETTMDGFRRGVAGTPGVAAAAVADNFAAPEALRLMARNLTKMMRNRFLTNLGESFAAIPGIEFGLAEDMPDCDAYKTQVEAQKQRSPENTDQGKKLTDQAPLDTSVTRTSLNKRYELCMQTRQLTKDVSNPVVAGNQLMQGDPNKEDMTMALNRANIEVIDRAGMDARKIQLPEGVQLQQDQYMQEVTDYSRGIDNPQKTRKTNAQQLAEYKDGLKEAARGFKEVAARAPHLKDVSDHIMSYAIEPEAESAIQINDFTSAQARDLNKAPITHPGRKTDLHEQTAAELTVTKR